MLGGAGRGKFYVSEVGRIEQAHAANLPPSGYTDQQIEAGYEKLAKSFGFYATLLFMEKQTPYTRDQLLGWTVRDFKFNLRYISWKGHVDEAYAKIMKEKK